MLRHFVETLMKMEACKLKKRATLKGLPAVQV